MTKELNLVEILKNAPKGTKLYSPMCGECSFMEVRETFHHPIIVTLTDGSNLCFAKDGRWSSDHQGECLLFPSRENRDWSTFTVEEEDFKIGDHIKHKNTGAVCVLTQKSQNREGFWAKRIICPFDDCDVYISEHEFGSYEKVDKFDFKWLKPFDRVLMRAADDAWFITFFSHFLERTNYPYVSCHDEAYKYCVPFNEETKHLVGTSNEEPEFYKID